MTTENQEPRYQIWRTDHSASEPMDLPSLSNAVSAKEVEASDWIYVHQTGIWQQASDLPEIAAKIHQNERVTLDTDSQETSDQESEGYDIKISSLRRISLLSDLTDDQIARFVQSMEVHDLPAFRKVVKKGEHGDAMYFILEGEVRVCVNIKGKESTLAVLSAGQFFGEIAVLDEGRRSSDVETNQESILLKMSAEAFQQLMKNEPDVALPVLHRLSKSLATRFRIVSKKYEDSVHWGRTAAGH